MAKIYAPPKDLPVPEHDYSNFDMKKIQNADDEWTEKLRQYCLANGRDPERGEVVSFPWADGRAMYMVFSMKPLALIHMPLGDAWQYPDADLQTAARIRENIRRSKALSALFSRQPVPPAPPVPKGSWDE
jgi:hypothetical protein